LITLKDILDKPFPEAKLGLNFKLTIFQAQFVLIIFSALIYALILPSLFRLVCFNVVFKKGTLSFCCYCLFYVVKFEAKQFHHLKKVNTQAHDDHNSNDKTAHHHQLMLLK